MSRLARIADFAFRRRRLVLAGGILALVAEGGWAGQLVGIDTPTPVPPFIPIMMFAILFGLSMDYEVFLVLIGVGMASAIAVDATIVRMVLVPAVMQILGDRSWWLPRWLDRVLPEGGIEGLLSAFADQVSLLEPLVEFFLRANAYSLVEGLGASTTSAATDGPGAFSGPYVGGEQALIVLSVYLAAFLVVSGLLLRRRDVT